MVTNENEINKNQLVIKEKKNHIHTEINLHNQNKCYWSKTKK